MSKINKDLAQLSEHRWIYVRVYLKRERIEDPTTKITPLGFSLWFRFG
jgi:hypothetical protein